MDIDEITEEFSQHQLEDNKATDFKSSWNLSAALKESRKFLTSIQSEVLVEIKKFQMKKDLKTDGMDSETNSEDTSNPKDSASSKKVIKPCTKPLKRLRRKNYGRTKRVLNFGTPTKELLRNLSSLYI